jgi:hypothetical protein
MSAPGPNSPQYVKSKKVSLKAHPDLHEKWLQDHLAKDPSLLNLGDALTLEGKEVPVRSGGKLDLLFKDSNDGTRYAVEVQLGAIDASHITRTIEYWLFLKDKPKRVPVLVAEDFNVRFSNVVDKFEESFDLIAIQVQALEVAGQITLAFIRRFDSEDEAGKLVSPQDWKQPTLPLVDQIFKIAQAVDSSLALVYNQRYISAAKGGNNFLTFQPQKSFVRLNVRTAQTDELNSKASMLGGEFKRGKYRFKLSPENVTTQIGALTDLIQLAYAGWS